MGLLNRQIEKRATIISGGSLENPANWMLRLFGANSITSAGIDVNEKNALLQIDLLTCVRIIAETIAQLPLITYKEIPTGGRKRAKGHPLYAVLQERANEEMTAFVLKETLQAHLLTWGNAYAWIERNDVGDCVGLWPLLPDRTWPLRDPQGNLMYQTLVKKLPIPGDPGIRRIFDARDVFHIPGLGFDGLVGYSVIHMIREQLGLAQAQEEYGGRFYSNGGTPPMALTYQKALGQTDIDRIKAEWDDGHRGVKNAWKMALLDQGMDIKTLGIPQQDAQFIESRRFSAEKIAGFYRVPANMMGAGAGAGPYGVGKEQDQIGFTIFTIMPWAVRWEHAIDMKLLLRPRDSGYFVKFLMDGLQRGDFKSRMEGYQLGWGKWWTTDEIRELEEQNPYLAPEDPKDIGKTLIWPIQYTTAELVVAGETIKKLPAPGETPAPNPGPGDPQGVNEPADPTIQQAAIRRAIARAQRIAFSDVAHRILKRESDDLHAISKKRSKSDWLPAFLEGHREDIKRLIAPQFETYAALIGADVSREIGRSAETPAAFVAKYVDGYVARHVAASMGDLKDVLAGTPEEIAATFGAWVERSDWIASREANQAGNAFARAAYHAAGVPFLMWMTGDECPDCVSLHGKQVPIAGVFAKRGEIAEDRFVPASGLGHPPLCEGCECVVVAAGPRLPAEPIVPMLRGEPPPVPVQPIVNVNFADGAFRAGATTTTIAEGAIRSDVNIAPTEVTVQPAQISIAPPAITVAAAPTPSVTVMPPAVRVEQPKVQVDVHVPDADSEMTIEYDSQGRVKGNRTRKIKHG